MSAKEHKDMVFQLKVTLEDVRPPVWRRLLVPGDMPLGVFHDVLQTAMGWTDCHLHCFEKGGQYYGPLDAELDDAEDEDSVRLRDVLRKPKSAIFYEYDFGDGWRHRVLLEKKAPDEDGDALPRCVAGRGACPPEDVGGPHGYSVFQAAMKDPNHPDHAQYAEWIGETAFDPSAFDLEGVNAQLVEWAGAIVGDFLSDEDEDEEGEEELEEDDEDDSEENVRRRMRTALLTVVKEQIRLNDPPETQQALLRLKSEGFSDENARMLIAGAVLMEIFDTLKNQKPFNRDRYLRNLKSLPAEPQDE